MRACSPREMEHLSEEFTNASSADATGNRRRFQAENLRQITIYQLMKPLKITHPHHPRRPPEPQSFCAHCPRHCITYTSTGCTPRSGSGVTHTLHYLLLIFFNKTIAEKKKNDIFGQSLPLILNNTHSRTMYKPSVAANVFFFPYFKEQKN